MDIGVLLGGTSLRTTVLNAMLDTFVKKNKMHLARPRIV